MNTTPNFNLDHAIFSVAMNWGGDVELADTKAFASVDEIQELVDDRKEDIAFIIESNPVEGYCRDVTEDFFNGTMSRNYRPLRKDPNHEHRISNFEAGTGQFGPFSGRAA
ncbi:hypothetical protein [Roseibium sp.]|uniref:hypothetical protein n=1 Tax=Roseibium sp. TaxID=1936156 RepID=UPI003B51A7C1